MGASPISLPPLVFQVLASALVDRSGGQPHFFTLPPSHILARNIEGCGIRTCGPNWVPTHFFPPPASHFLAANIEGRGIRTCGPKLGPTPFFTLTPAQLFSADIEGRGIRPHAPRRGRAPFFCTNDQPYPLPPSPGTVC